MATLTDPARELGEIAEKLATSSSQPGSAFLAKQFGVDEWSTEFVKIIACIMERADLVGRIITKSGMDDDHRKNALRHIRLFKTGFAGASLANHWDNSGHGLTAMRDNGQPIQFFSQTVRPVVKYPRLSVEETAELIASIDIYLAALQDNVECPEFVRQAITDGLDAFRFQLDKLGWMGSGYALAAFRNAVDVYQAASSVHSTGGNPNADSFLAGFWNILKSFKDKVDEAKEWKEAAENIWTVYGHVSRLATPLLISSHVSFLPPNSLT